MRYEELLGILADAFETWSDIARGVACCLCIMLIVIVLFPVMILWHMPRMMYRTYIELISRFSDITKHDL